MLLFLCADFSYPLYVCIIFVCTKLFSSPLLFCETLRQCSGHNFHFILFHFISFPCRFIALTITHIPLEMLLLSPVSCFLAAPGFFLAGILTSYCRIFSMSPARCLYIICLAARHRHHHGCLLSHPHPLTTSFNFSTFS